MAELRIRSDYDPLPRQIRFHLSPAKVRGYGGAMGGGKSRALCEDVFQELLDYPGIQIPIFRFRHVSITETTKRTMLNETIPPELLRLCRTRSSGGEDYIRLPNGSTVHFAGLDDPVRWFSSELGGVCFDEAHEIPEDSVVKLMTRLRQRGMPRRTRLCFNPENPGHWLYRWFIAGADKTDTGYAKKDLWPSEASNPIGDAEFVFAKASDNPYLPEGYVEQELGGLPEMLRRRYLEGEWLFVTGSCFFDLDALTDYADLMRHPLERFDFRVAANGSKASRSLHDSGHIRVYVHPQAGHTYAIGADVATGHGKDFSTAYVIDLDTMEFAAEYHGKIDSDLYAAQLHFLGRWYNSALIAVESAGGYGEPVIISLRDGRDGRPAYPRLYRHILSSRPDLPISKPFGFPMNMKTRPLVLAQLEKALRERSLPFVTERLLDEAQTFVYQDTGTSPRSQEGCNDDAVMAAAIALEMYRLRGRHPLMDERRAGRRTREVVTAYPWLTDTRAEEGRRRDFDRRYPKEGAAA